MRTLKFVAKSDTRAGILRTQDLRSEFTCAGSLVGRNPLKCVSALTWGDVRIESNGRTPNCYGRIIAGKHSV